MERSEPLALRRPREALPLSQRAEPFYSDTNQAYILKSVRELRAGKGHPHDLIEAGSD